MLILVIGVRADDVLQMALPAVAALIGRSAIEHGLVGDALEIEVERGVDAQAGAVDLFCAELALELAPDLLDKVGGNRVRRGLDVQAQGSGLQPLAPLRA